MLNKKLGLLIMSAAMVGLVACSGDQKSSATGLSTETRTSQAGTTSEGGASQGGESGQETSHATGLLPNIPEVEGKIAVYFTYEDVDGGVALADIPSFCSPFITGNWNGYATTPDAGAQEMKLLGDSNVFYAYLPADGEFGDMGYQITLGYNAASGVGTSKQGINWSYKTIYSDENFPGLDHPVLTKMNDKVYAALNTDHPASAMAFSQVLSEPVTLKDTEIKFKVDLGNQALPENLEYVVKGAFNGWATQSVGAPDTEGYYHVALGDDEGNIIVGTYEMCFGIRNKLVGGDMDDKYTLARKNEETDVYGGLEEAEGEGEDLVYTISNIVLGMSAIDGDGYSYNVGTLVLPEHAKGTAKAFEFPASDVPYIPHTMVIRLRNTGTALAEAPYIAGTFTEWGHSSMEEVDENVYEYVIYDYELHLGDKVQYKFTDGAWDGVEVAPANGEGQPDGNFEFEAEMGMIGFEVSADLSGWAGKVVGVSEEIVEITLPETYLVTICVFYEGEDEVKKATVAGSFQGWNPAEAGSELVYDADYDGYCATFNFGGMKVNSKVEFKVTDGTWDHAIGTGSGNYVEYVSYGKQFYEYAGDIATFTGDLEPYALVLLAE